MALSLPPPDIVVDESGTMREDIFYKVTTEKYSLWHFLPDADKQGFTVLPPKPFAHASPDEPNWLTAHAHQWRDSLRTDMLCPAKGTPAHQRQPFVEDLQGDLFDGPAVADFVIDVTIGWLLVTSGFARLLRETTLTGYDLRPFKVIVNQSEVPKIELFHLQPCGFNCERPPHITRGENLCPFCKRSPVFCSTCGNRWFTCPNCRSQMHVTPGYQGPDDKRLLIQRNSRNGGILDGNRWDGSDFMTSHDHMYFSGRAFEWMMTIHAGPLVGIPARFCVDGMDARNRKRLAKMADSSTTVR